MKYLSVCSGIEAATSAWHHLGWEPVAFSEIEPFPSAVLQHHYPNVPNWGDMTQYQTWPDATIDLLVGGTPCQSFSIAGLRQGLKDPRGNLMLTFLGIAQRYRPKYIVWENVPGVLSSNGGRDFGAFLAALGELGYGWAYRVLDAQWFGVAQRRRRVFVVGCLGDQRRAAQILFESESVRRDTPPSREKGQGAAADAQGSVGSRGECADTVTSKWAKGAEALQQGAQSGGNCIPVHAFKVRGGCEGGGKGYLGSDDTAFTVATHQDQHIATYPINGMCINKELRDKQMTGIGDEGDSMFTMRADGTQHAVAFASHDVCPTINTVSQRFNHDHESTAYAIPAMQVTAPANYSSPQSIAVRTANTSANGHGISAELAHTLDQAQGQAVAFTTEQTPKFSSDAALTLTKQSPSGGGQPQCVMTTMQVRRLTPVECERLQGFPDNHTNIPWRGKAEAPDGPRYKALGNSMAVPVMRWIGERINRP